MADHVVARAREIWAALGTGAAPGGGVRATGGSVACAAAGWAGMSGIPAEMRAALLRDFGELDVAEVPVPEPGAGEVLCGCGPAGSAAPT